MLFLLAYEPAPGVLFLEEDTRNMQGMRQIEQAIKALYCIVERPSASKCYEDLANFYSSIGMHEDSEALKYLISEKFCAHDPDNYTEQLQDAGQMP
jgi:hypothetical protein